MNDDILGVNQTTEDTPEESAHGVRTINITREGDDDINHEGARGPVQMASGMMSVANRLKKKTINPDDQETLEQKAKRLNIPTRHIVIDEVPYDILDYVPEDSALHYQVIPLSQKDGVVEVGMVDPDSIEARNALTFIFQDLIFHTQSPLFQKMIFIRQ